jgi:hypothetical protein
MGVLVGTLVSFWMFVSDANSPVGVALDSQASPLSHTTRAVRCRLLDADERGDRSGWQRVEADE